ncbi:hypothetical protein E2320_015530 [Naja naja]|nr:hypothetical protein E2320_015530 [Naja naja]
MDAANLSDIPSNRKKAYFLSFCGATVFDTATAMLAPQTVKAVSWEELQEVLGNHYAPKPSRISRRQAFRSKNPSGKRICHVSAAAIQKAINLPGSKPSTAINYEDAAYEDEYLEERKKSIASEPSSIQKKRPLFSK